MTRNDARVLGAVIERDARRANMSNAELARRVFVDASYVGMVLTGKRFVSLKVLDRMAVELGCRASNWLREIGL